MTCELTVATRLLVVIERPTQLEKKFINMHHPTCQYYEIYSSSAPDSYLLLSFVYSVESDENTKILIEIKKQLRLENGGDNCSWTDTQIEGKY